MIAPDLTREEWLALRRGTLGGSEAAAACGESPWESPYSLWAKKAGLVEPTAEETEEMEWGLLVEEPLLRLYRKRTQRRLVPDELADRARVEALLASDGATEVVGWVEGRQPFLRSVARPWQTATLDAVGFVDDLGGIGYVDAKHSQWGGDAWDESEGMPDHYALQLAHGVAVCPALQWGSLAARVAGRFRVLDLARDRMPVDALVSLESDFMARVASRTPPAIDGSEATARTIRRVHPDDNGQSIVLPAQAAGLHDELTRALEDRKEAEDRERSLKTMLTGMLGPNTFGILPDGRGTYSFKTQERAEYVAKATKFRVLRYSNPKR